MKKIITLATTIAFLTQGIAPNYNSRLLLAKDNSLRPAAYRCQKASRNPALDIIAAGEIRALLDRLSEEPPREKERLLNNILSRIHYIGRLGRIILSFVNLMHSLILILLRVPYIIPLVILGLIYFPVLTLLIIGWYCLCYLLIYYASSGGCNVGGVGIWINKNTSETEMVKGISHEAVHTILSNHEFLPETVSELRSLERQRPHPYIYLDVLEHCRNTPLIELEGTLKTYVRKGSRGADAKLMRFITLAHSEKHWHYGYGRVLAHAIVLLCGNDFNKAYAVVRNMTKGDSLVEALKKSGIDKTDRKRISRYDKIPVKQFNSNTPASNPQETYKPVSVDGNVAAPLPPAGKGIYPNPSLTLEDISAAA